MMDDVGRLGSYCKGRRDVGWRKLEPQTSNLKPQPRDKSSNFEKEDVVSRLFVVYRILFQQQAAAQQQQGVCSTVEKGTL
jgi:hypothetical protein